MKQRFQFRVKVTKEEEKPELPIDDIESLARRHHCLRKFHL